MQDTHTQPRIDLPSYIWSASPMLCHTMQDTHSLLCDSLWLTFMPNVQEMALGKQTTFLSDGWANGIRMAWTKPLSILIWKIPLSHREHGVILTGMPNVIQRRKALEMRVYCLSFPNYFDIKTFFSPRIFAFVHYTLLCFWTETP